MTRTFAVDANNDLVIGSDDRLRIATDLEAVLQNCEHAAKTILNEMVLAQGEGIPYFEAVWVGVPNLAVWEASFRARVLAVADVLSIDALTLGREGETLTYRATITTVYGTGEIANG
jgi:hypothetical protein